MSKRIGIGIAGLGTVGGGVVKTLRKNSALIKRQCGVEIQLVRAVELNRARFDELRIPETARSSDIMDLVNDPAIDIVIELIGGTTIAKTLTLKALEAGKHIVTANKALLAKHWAQVFGLAHRKGCAIGFETSVMAGVPVIRSLQDGLAGNVVRSMRGILNGTTNFILTRMAEEFEEFPVALAEAQRLGMCEANASLDIDGFDPAQKLAILASIATGRWLPPNKVLREGIGHIQMTDIIEAREEFGYVLRPMAICKVRPEGVEARVHPTFVPADHVLANVSGAYNALCIDADPAGPITLVGQGAGEGAAASGIVSDTVTLARALGADGKENIPVPLKPSSERTQVVPAGDMYCKFYLRFTVLDRPGVLGFISGVLGEHHVSIASCYQREFEEKEPVAIIVVTHEAREDNLRKALSRIDRSRKIVKQKTVAIRIEE